MTDESALLLTVSVYNDWHLVSIRIHTYLRRFLTTDAEFRLRRDEYKRLLKEQVYERHVNLKPARAVRPRAKGHLIA